MMAQRVIFAALVCLALTLQIFYLANMVRWRHAPDVGWTPFRGLGPRFVGYTTPVGDRAGLRPLDKILTLNGRSYDTYDELNSVTDFAIGHVNEYLIERDGRLLTVRVTNVALGLRTVVFHSGLYWILGLIFTGIGILVFLMKPYHGPSWAFLSMTTVLGTIVSYFNPVYFYQPSWLTNVLIFVLALFPATILHLAALFPERHRRFAETRWLILAPYAGSLALGVVSRSFGSRLATVPDWLFSVEQFYLLGSLIVFLGSTIYTYKTTPSLAMRLQSLVVFSGMTLALFVPMVELLSNLVLKVSLVPNPIFFYVASFLLLPVSIGYAIVRHDLFEIDVIIRRTYGYVLSTAAIVATYAAVASTLNVVFQSSEISRSPAFSIAMALGIVFAFEPLHRRIQRVVDRVFYRQQYDYRKTIKNISEAMTSILDAEKIRRTLIGSIVREMFLENGVLLLPDPRRQAYHVGLVEGADVAAVESKQITADDPILQVLNQVDDAILRHDLDLHPRYADTREPLRKTFQALRSDVMMPMKYSDQLEGILSLGRKKSGKMFTPEDLDLLKTMINQTVIALENAKLFQENLAKGRLEEELNIARDIQVSMLPDRAPSIPGCQIVARSVPAREVGGDFYDFIEVGEGRGDRVGIVVGDVSGKAVSGALVMAASRSIVRVLAEAHPSVADVMRIANERLSKDIKKGMFVALVYAVFYPDQRTLRLANAGQTQPIVCPRDGSPPSYVDTEGDRFPLGIVRESAYKETEVLLHPGDTVVFYTDGVVEAMNGKGELYGFERLLATIEDGRGLRVDQLLDRLVDDVARYANDVEQHDDLTIVVLRAE